MRASPDSVLGLVTALEALPSDINPGDDLGEPGFHALAGLLTNDVAELQKRYCPDRVLDECMKQI